MFDLDNIDAVETPENDLEEVVMGLTVIEQEESEEDIANALKF